MRLPAALSKAESHRRRRLGHLRRLVQFRYGPTLPNDDAGVEDLAELLKPISLGPDPVTRMHLTIEVMAPWMPKPDADELVRYIAFELPKWERRPTAAKLGERMLLTNLERERLHLWTIDPCDMTKEQMAEQRKAKDRARKAARRRQRGAKSRSDYLAASKSKLKPWEAEGISRPTWYRWQKAIGTSPSAVLAGGETGVSAMNSYLPRTDLSHSPSAAVAPGFHDVTVSKAQAKRPTRKGSRNFRH